MDDKVCTRARPLLVGAVAARLVLVDIVMDDRVEEDDGGYALPPLSEEASKASSIMPSIMLL